MSSPIILSFKACHSGKWEEVTSLLNRIMNEGVHPNLVTFNSLINALWKEKRIEEAITMLNLMRIPPDVVTFNSLINALCKEKRIEEAITMLELLSQRGVKLYGVTYNIMIRLYCGQGEMIRQRMSLIQWEPRAYGWNIGSMHQPNWQAEPVKTEAKRKQTKQQNKT
ncbi:hypothetical protein Goshw_028874 [Gossypium schwendimanii]|uniref:Pentatricopeptide repeat-containing protein n=1 Tax=Gossypium schwendimanii TaxID=34291 RepID=A0A7J9NEH1_GOSSC|nr:hypothetical protein [Gossypium schwendimanii]